jgi:cellulose synthase/poly-beta-1,6-N-acetylglucosamine synthase-like glycosyltransferase
LNPRPHLLLTAALAVFASIIAWLALSAAQLQRTSFSACIYALANLIVFTDAIDFIVRVYMHRRHSTGPATAELSTARLLSINPAMVTGGRRRAPLRPYAIVASIFNLDNELERFMEAMAPYRDRVWLISDGSTDYTVTRLRQGGWRCIDDGLNRHKPGALRRLLDTLPDHIDSVLVIDPDVRIRGVGEGSLANLERIVGDFQQSGAAALCPRIMIEPDGFLGRFQAFEYALSFALGRRSLADYNICSGICLYRRDALRRALGHHSLSVYAEDLETALILLAAGERIYYDGRLVVSTEGPSSVRRWFSQRVGWYYGLIKVYVERFAELGRVSARQPFAAYHFVGYMGLLTIAMHPVRVLCALLLLLSIGAGFDQLFALELLPQGGLTTPIYCSAAFGSYLLLVLIELLAVVPRAERSYVAPILPLYLLYALANIAATTVGFANWAAMRWLGRRLYRDHYEPAAGGEAVLQPQAVHKSV